MNIVLLINYSEIENIMGFINFLKKKPAIFLMGNKNNYTDEYLNKNNILIIDKKVNIKKYNYAITFDYKVYSILKQINYRGKVIHYFNELSIKLNKKQVPNSTLNKMQSLICLYNSYQKKYMKKFKIKNVKTFPYLKILDLKNIPLFIDLDIEFNSILYYASSNSKIDELIFEISKDIKVFILFPPDKDINTINYYLKNDNIYFINRCYYSNKYLEEQNCINLIDIYSSLDILQYFNYLVCDNNNIFYEGLILNKKCFRIDLIEFDKLNAYNIINENLKCSLCPFSKNNNIIDIKYNNFEGPLENIIKKLLKK